MRLDECTGDLSFAVERLLAQVSSSGL